MRHAAFALASVIALVVAACGGAAGTSRPAPASPPQAAVMTRSPSASHPPSPPLPLGETLAARVVGGAPVIVGDVHGPEGYPNANPGAVVRGPDGTYHLYIAWFGDMPGDEVVTHSTSSDAVDWTVGTEPIYDDLGIGLNNPGPVPAEALIVGDEWVLYGWGALRGARRADASWRATAPAPDGPWTATADFELSAGAAGTWDGGAAVLNSVVSAPDGFRLWYEGYPEVSGPESIGLAIGDDGITFTKEANPAIPAGSCGTAPDAKTFQPSGLQTADGFLMVFGGQEFADGPTRVFAATSPDGRTWSCAAEGPLPGLERFSGSNWVHTLQAFDRGGQPAVLLEVLAGDHTEVWLADIVAG